ncbi:MAG: transferase [Burkholderiales bacterium]|jgi:glycosyltransferase involved in cell wall biosynthesis|nr:transferase [Burkholderiales bacterium]
MARAMTERRPRSGALFVGRLDAESGVGILLEALDLYPGARVDMIGAGPEEARLRAHARVGLLGRVGPAEVQERMRAAAYLVMPSLAYEAAPRPLIEAFANALPVIASRLGALAELVEPGRNGLLFEPGSARDLARRLAWAEAFPEKIRQMGECARADYESRFIGDWSWQKLYGERRRGIRVPG